MLSIVSGFFVVWSRYVVAIVVFVVVAAFVVVCVSGAGGLMSSLLFVML